MNSHNKNFKNKLIGVLGLGLSGKAVIRYLINKSAKIVVWDDSIKIRSKFENVLSCKMLGIVWFECHWWGYDTKFPKIDES